MSEEDYRRGYRDGFNDARNKFEEGSGFLRRSDNAEAQRRERNAHRPGCGCDACEIPYGP